MENKNQAESKLRFLVVWQNEFNNYNYMETAWTDEEVNSVGKWKVISEHENKEETRIECARLNDTLSLKY